MSQELRNKIYGTVTGVFGLLVTLGVVDQATSDQATTITTAGLDLAPEVIGFLSSLLAFVKSMPSRVTTLETPKHHVAEVVDPHGFVTAGPASPRPDGTLLGRRQVEG
jgi:hypothetical protein